jgi:hypothetical protein
VTFIFPVIITSFTNQVSCIPVTHQLSGDRSDAISAGLNKVNNEKTHRAIPIIGIAKTRINFNFGFIQK